MPPLGLTLWMMMLQMFRSQVPWRSPVLAIKRYQDKSSFQASHIPCHFSFPPITKFIKKHKKYKSPFLAFMRSASRCRPWHSDTRTLILGGESRCTASSNIFKAGKSYIAPHTGPSIRTTLHTGLGNFLQTVETVALSRSSSLCFRILARRADANCLDGGLFEPHDLSHQRSAADSGVWPICITLLLFIGHSSFLDAMAKPAPTCKAVEVCRLRLIFPRPGMIGCGISQPRGDATANILRASPKETATLGHLLQRSWNTV